MNCPNCGKKPTGLFYVFISDDFDLKTRMQGYFKCQHCGTTLKQQKTRMGFPSFSMWYYLYATIVVGLVGVGSFYLFDMFDQQNVGVWIRITAFILILGLVLSGINALANRYRNITEVEEIEKEVESNKLTKTGVGAFAVYLIVAIGLFLAVNRYIDMRELGFVIYLIFQMVYLVAVMLGAFFLFKKFEKEEDVR